MTLHARHEPTVRAGIALSQAVTSAVAEYKLTYGELMAILSAEIADWAKRRISDERNVDMEQA